MKGIESRERGALLKTVPIAFICALSFLALSCGNRFFSATLSGYVRETGADPGTEGAGIDGAEVRVYLTAPTTGLEEGYVVKTSTMTSGNQSGYWSHKVMWENWTPSFPDEGDSGAVWVSVRRPGFFPDIIEVSGILSDANNVIPTIELERILMSSLRGRVVNSAGQGLNGVRLVLDLSTTAATDDYAATTATDDGEPGYFQFDDVAWIDADSLPAAAFSAARAIAAGAATETAYLRVDDPAWFGAVYDAATPLALTLNSGEDRDISATPIVAASADFERGVIEGRVVDSTGAGVNGASVSLDLGSNGVGADYTATTMRLVSHVGQEDGWYRFTNVSWTDPSPEHPAGDPAGDEERAAIYPNDADYASAVSAEEPVFALVPSDPEGTQAAYSVSQSITVQRAAFLVPLVEGRVTDGANGLNGITVRLDLESTGSGTDATAVTREIGGVTGRFQFSDIAWTDSSPENPELERALVSIDEGDWTGTSQSLSLSPGVSVTGGTALQLVTARRTTWQYTATVSGRILLRYDTGAGLDVRGLSGVWVRLADDGTNGVLLSSSIPAAGVQTQTAADGSYSFTLTWSRAAGFVPAGPNGGDDLSVTLAVDDLNAATADPGPVSIAAQSWSQATGVPDLFYDAP
jgi:hypothetical protein